MAIIKDMRRMKGGGGGFGLGLTKLRGLQFLEERPCRFFEHRRDFSKHSETKSGARTFLRVVFMLPLQVLDHRQTQRLALSVKVKIYVALCSN